MSNREEFISLMEANDKAEIIKSYCIDIELKDKADKRITELESEIETQLTIIRDQQTSIDGLEKRVQDRGNRMEWLWKYCDHSKTPNAWHGWFNDEGNCL